MLTIADTQFQGRLFTGTGKFSDPNMMLATIKASHASMVTFAMKRIDFRQQSDQILQPLLKTGIELLPNTSGARNAKEAIFAAHLARDARNHMDKA